MAAPSDEERERVLELLNTEFDKRIEAQVTAGQAIDTKGTFVVGFILVALQIFAGQHRSTQPWLALALVTFAVAFVLGVVAVWPREYKTVPVPQEMLADYEQALTDGPPNLYENFIASLAATKVVAVERNATTDKVKVRYWRIAVVAFGLAVTFATLNVVVKETKSGKQPVRRGQATTSTTAAVRKAGHP